MRSGTRLASHSTRETGIAESPNAEAIAKHARAMERLSVTAETLESALALIRPSVESSDHAASLGVDLLDRERTRLASAIEDLR